MCGTRSFFLEKWIDHYGALVGRENLFVVIDGDDWEPEVDLTGIETEVLLDAPRRRIRNDRFMAKEMSARANRLRKRYAHVIRGDVDEYVVVDPASGLDWPEALEELTEEGYIFALGRGRGAARIGNAAARPRAPILGQRRHGFVADRYTKPFVISRWNNWSGGAHRLLNRPVVMSRHFTLFHMALADKGVAEERLAARGGLTQHRSFVGHQTDRLDAIAQTGAARWTSPRPAAIAHRDFPVEPDGSIAKRPARLVPPGGGGTGAPGRNPRAVLRAGVTEGPCTRPISRSSPSRESRCPCSAGSSTGTWVRARRGLSSSSTTPTIPAIGALKGEPRLDARPCTRRSGPSWAWTRRRGSPGASERR
jgi:hypothetical protein